MPTKILKTRKGTYRLAVTLGTNLRGQQIVRYKTVKAANITEARQKYRRFEAQVLTGKDFRSKKLLLVDFARRWYQEYVKKELAPKTVISYRNHLEKRILPALGHLDIHNIRPIDVLHFTHELQEKGQRFDKRKTPLSDKSIQYCFRVLSSMLQDAVEWQIIETNPCLHVRRPRVRRTKVKVPTEQLTRDILAALEGEPLLYQAIIYLAIDSGLRRGELMGLKWSDIDFETKTLHVVRSNQSLTGRGTFSKTPKTEESIRDVAVSDNSLELLRQLHVMQMKQKFKLGEQWQDGNWVFAGKNGKALYDSTPSHWFTKFLKRKNLPHISFHSLRHLSATILIAQGIPLKNVSSRLGHADIKTTANIYVDALRSVDMEAAEKMNDFLKNNGGAVKENTLAYTSTTYNTI